MAAPSPALSNTSSDTAAALPAPAAAVLNAINRTDTPPKTLRGLNKPKCKQCGNVARSRCPYESCKNCCAKAQNPCHIHVLKANATFVDKVPASSSPLFDQQSTEPSSSLSSHRVASFRQLSSTFSQFNNVQIPLRSKKPLTKKDAASINEWRFSKLKEYKERNIEVENEAFDRYIQNVGLLEALFSTKSRSDGSTEVELSTSNHNPDSMEDENSATILELKSTLRSNPARTNNFRKRIAQIVDQGLEKLKRPELVDCDNMEVDQKELVKGSKRAKEWWSGRASTLGDLIDKLNKARNEEDLKSFLEVKSQLFKCQTESRSKSSDSETLTEQTSVNELESVPETSYSLPKLISSVEIDHKVLVSVDAHFSSLEKIANL